MVNPKTVYYTFRLLEGESLTVQCMKWDSMVSEDEPIETYKIQPDNPSYFGACDCPAYRKCKHLKCVLEAQEQGFLDNIWEYIWRERSGWEKSDEYRPWDEL